MARPQKRHKTQRFFTNRFKTTTLKDAPFTVAPHGKGAGRLLMTSIFLACVILVLNFPTSGPRLREGQIAKRDYRARTPFKALDEEATRRSREEAAEQATRVFQENSDHLARLGGELKAFIEQVVAARRPDELMRTARRRWGLTREKFGCLTKHLEKKWIGPGIEAIEAAMEEAARSGIVAASEHEAELASERYEIEVRLSDSGPNAGTRPIVRTIAYPAALRRFFSEELLLWLRDKPAEFREVLLDMLVHAAKPTLKLDEAATAKAVRAARDAVGQRDRTIAKGSIILGAGDRATRRAIEEIELEEKAFAGLGRIARDQEGEGDRFRRRVFGALGLTAVFLIGLLLLAFYGFRFARDALTSNTRVFGIYIVCLVTLVALRVLAQFGFALHWTPVILAAMILVIATGPTLAFGAIVLLAAAAGVVGDGGLSLTLPLLIGGGVSILGLTRVRRRTDPLEAGVLAGLACGVAVWALYLARIPGADSARVWPFSESLAGLGGGVLAGVVLTASLPYVERFFDVATDLRLLEWTDQNQPLLRKLALEAPGTYHHSTVVSHLAEAAAEAIGANTLIARAAAYLHDVGKLNRPDYYVENVTGRPSRHDTLSPTMSTLILTSHPKDGSEIAKSYGVPTPLRRIIREHHGTSVVQYFYRKACEEAKDSSIKVKVTTFRYRTPKPRTPESAIVMLADSVESAARSLDGASPGRIKRLVHEIVSARIEDGQLDESRMNITDIRRVEASLVRSLTAVMHLRISYP